MRDDQTRDLRSFQPRHSRFVAIDSDGCVFDSMGEKQRNFFVPITIRHWGLERIGALERETHEFVNLRSRWRGSNRFVALIKVFDLLAEREEVKAAGLQMPNLDALRRWLATGVAVGQPALEREVARTGDPSLKRALDWSRAINQAIKERYKPVPPFPHVKESLERLYAAADVVCVSATPRDALEREWRDNQLVSHVALLAALEVGSKREQLEALLAGKYPKGHALMVGDAFGDLAAAHDTGALFYPIIAGEEEECWRRFHDEIIDLFLSGRYSPEIESSFIERFSASLPEQPPWRQA